MSEQRVATLVVEVAGRKTNIEAVLSGLQQQLRGATTSATTATSRIGGDLAAGSTKAAKELLQLAQAAQKVAQEEQRTAQASARVSQELAKVGQQQARAATEGAKLAQAQAKVAQEEQKAAQQAQKLAAETARATAAQSRAQIEALRLAAAQERAASGNSNWAGSLGQAASKVDNFIGTLQGLGGAFAVVGAAQGLYSFAQQGAAIDAARKSFDQLALSAGTSGKALLASLQEAAAGTVANADIIKSSNTALLLLGADVANQLPQLLAVAKASATTLGTDVGQVFDSLVTGISRGSTELIDNAGITVKAGEAYAQYAASIGKSAEDLSAAEKQQALLNSVLTAGQTIIDQTSGGAEAASVNFQRFEASLANLQAAAGGLAAVGLAPLAAGLAEVAQAAADGITALQEVEQQNQNIAVRLVAGAGSYEEYAQRVAQAQQLAQQALEEAYAKDPIGRLVAQATGAIPVIEQLSRAQVDLAVQMQASGSSAEQAFAAVSAATPAMTLLGEAIDYAALRTPGAVEGIKALEPAIVATATASETARAQVEATLDAYNNGKLTAQELATAIENIGITATASGQAAQVAAAGTADAQAALMGFVEATTDATLAQVDAAQQDAAAKAEQAAQAELVALKNQDLIAAIQGAVAAGQSGIGISSAIAGQHGVEAGTVASLIGLYQQLQAARAGQTVAANQATRRGRDGGLDEARNGGATAPGLTRAQLERIEAQKAAAFQAQLQNQITRATGSTADQLALVNAELAKAPRFSQEAMRLEVEKARLLQRQATEAERAAKAGGAGAGGAGKAGGAGTKSAAVKAGEREAEQLRKLQEQRLGDQERIARQLEDLDRDSAERRLKIAEEFARKRQEAEESFADAQSGGRSGFYQGLASVDKSQRTAMIQEYEQAQLKAAEVAKEKGAEAGEKYLSAITDLIRKRADRQADIAEALKKGDEDEAEFLRGVDAIARADEQRQLDKITSGKGGLAEEEAQALAGEDQRYAEAQAKIGEAADKAAERKIAGAQKSQEAIAAETAELQRQADLLATMNQQRLASGLSAGASGAGSAPSAPSIPAAPAAAATAPQAGAGGPLATSDAGAHAILAEIVRGLESMKRAIDDINTRAPFVTG